MEPSISNAFSADLQHGSRFRGQSSFLRTSSIAEEYDSRKFLGSTLYDALYSGDGVFLPDSPAISVAGSPVKWTRQQLQDQVLKCSASLSEQLSKFSTTTNEPKFLAMCFEQGNSLSTVVTMLAALTMGGGAVAAPLSPELTTYEYAYSLKNMNASILVVDSVDPDGSLSELLKAANEAQIPIIDVALIFTWQASSSTSSSPSLLKRLKSSFSVKTQISRPRPDDPAIVLQLADGGDISQPPAVVYTHSNLIAGMAATINAYELTSADKTLISMPIFHAHGLCISLLSTLGSGGEMILPASGRFNAALFWSDVANTGVSWFSGVPAAVMLLLRHSKTWIAEGRPALRFVASSCGADVQMPVSMRSDFETTYKIPLIEAFALPEASILIACPQRSSSNVSTVAALGQPVRGMELEVRNGKELWMHSLSVGTQRVRNGTIVKNADLGAWVSTGRIGSLKKVNGVISVEEVEPDPLYINEGGDRLAFEEIEDALYGFPGSNGAIAFAVPHLIMGHVVGIVLAHNATGDAVPFNEDLCTYASACKEHPLVGKWLPQVTVLVQDLSDVPAEGVASKTQLARMLGFNAPLEGRVNATFRYDAATKKLVKLEKAAVVQKSASTRGRLQKQGSVLAREMADFSKIESQIRESYCAILGLDNEKENVAPETNFFDAGGASLQVLALIAEVQQRTGVKITQTDVFIKPTIKELAGHVATVARKGQNARKLSTQPSFLGPSQRLGAAASAAALQQVQHDPGRSSAGWQPASSNQEQMWVLDSQSYKAAYNMPSVLTLRHSLDAGTLRSAVLYTMQHDGALRTLLRLNPVSKKVEQLEIPAERAVECLEFVQHKVSSEKEGLALIQEEHNYAFDLEKGPTIRAVLVEITPTYHLFLLDIHHANSDGWSHAAHRRMVLQTYVALTTNQTPVLPTSSVTYLDYSAWQHAFLESQGENERQLAYWKKELEDAPILDLPFDRPRPAVLSEAGGKITLHIPANVVAQWKNLLSSKGCTLFMGAISLYHIVLGRWAGQEDVVVGAATANRTAHPDLAKNLGYFSNELAIRADLRGGPTYVEVLERVREKILAAWANQDVAWHHVVTALNIPRDSGTTPVFQAFFALQESSWHVIDVDTKPANGLEADILRVASNKAKFAIHLMLRERTDGGLDGDLLYPTDLWNEETVERLARQYETLVASAVGASAATTLPVNALQMLTKEEQQMIGMEWNDTIAEYKPQRIEAQILNAARKYPDVIAVEEHGGRRITYKDFAAQVDTVARVLRDLIPSDSSGATEFVALAFSREMEAVVAAVAVLRAGFAFMPIDVENTPPARVRAMVEDAKTKVFFMMDRYTHLEEELQGLGHSMEVLHWSSISAVDSEALNSKSFPMVPESNVDALAGLFYTSGSTGLPKGVMISHSNIQNLVYWWSNLVELSPAEQDKVLQFSSYSFIMSLRQIFPTLCTGTTLVLASAINFGAAIIDCGCTKAALTPSALATIDPEEVSSLRRVQVAGEAPTLSLAKTWAKKLEAFYIGLGPTELTAHACTGLFDPEATAVTIGMPVTNAAAYVVNEEGALQPPGVIGELWIAGNNVSQGYLNQPELTADRFIINPIDPKRFLHLYKTGDYARRLADGRVQFIGRNDGQVKVRGYRIELFEIVDAILESSTSIKRAEAMVVEGQIVAFVTPPFDIKTGEDAEVWKKLKQRLPSYMVPNRIIGVAEFPLNKNGKLDCQAAIALAEKSIKAGTNSVAASGSVDVMARRSSVVPSTAMERHVAAVWADVLGKDASDLSVNCNFWQHGGSSLSAILVVRRLGDILGCAVPVEVAFSSQNLGDFAALLETLVGDRGGATSDASGVNGSKAAVQQLSNVQGKPLPRWLYTLLQFFGILGVMICGLAPAGGAIAMCLYLILDQSSIGYASLPLLPFVWMAATVVNVICALIFKHLFFGGTLRSGVYSLFSPQFLKWYLQRRLTSTTRVWLWWVNNTTIACLVWRLFGARIKTSVSLDDAVLEDPDLISIDQNAHLQTFAALVPGELLGRALVLKEVSVGAGSRLEPRATVLGGGGVGENCIVRPWAAVTAATPVQNSYTLIGGPAAPERLLNEKDQPKRPKYTSSSLFILGQMLGCYFAILLLVLCFAAALISVRQVAIFEGGFNAAAYAFVAFPLSLFLAVLLVTIAAKWIVIFRVKPDQRYDSAFFGLRMWFMDRIFMSPLLRAATYVWLSEGSLYSVYLKALGARVGARCWWNRPLIHTGTDLLTVGGHFHGGHINNVSFAQEDAEGIVFSPVSLGNNVTLGQRVVLMPGVECGDNVTVGADGGVPTEMKVASDSTIFGSPPTVFTSGLSNEEAVKELQKAVLLEEGRVSSLGFAESNKLAPFQVSCRLALLAFANIAIVPAIGALYGLCYYLIVWLPLRDTIATTPAWLALLVPAVYIAGTFILTLLCALFPHIPSVGDFRTGSTPFFSSRFLFWALVAWLNDLLTGLLLYPIQGTQLFNWWMRAAGANVGANAFIVPLAGGFRELNHMTVGEDAVVFGTATGHYIDHDTLQFAPVAIYAGAVVNNGASMMPLTKLGAGSTARAVVTTVKGQDLPNNTVFMGSPATENSTI